MGESLSVHEALAEADEDLPLFCCRAAAGARMEGGRIPAGGFRMDGRFAFTRLERVSPLADSWVHYKMGVWSIKADSAGNLRSFWTG